MTDWGLAAAVAAAALFAAGCTVLPGLVARVAAVVRRRRAARPAVLGPLFWYELTRLARRGQQPRLRALYAGVLLVGLLVTYLNEFSEVNPALLIVGSGELVPLDRMASFSERFLATFLFCQLVGVVLITPVYAGGAVPEERDRGTLDFLRASLLTNREIVAAVLTARLVFVAGLVLAGLPILGLTMLFGGVAGEVLVGAFVVALMTVLSLGAFCLYLGVRGRGLREVLLWAYGVVGFLAVFGTCCGCIPVLGAVSPFTMTYFLLDPPAAPFWAWSADARLAEFVLLHGTVAAILTWRATAGIRLPPPAWANSLARLRRRKRGRVVDPDNPPPRPRPRPAEEPDRPRARQRPAARSFRVPRLGHADPLLWKERYFSGRMPGFERGILSGCAVSFAVLLVFPVGLWLFVALFEFAARGENPAAILNPLAKTVGFAAAVAVAPAVGVRAAVSVARERQRQTLDALFSLPVPRKAVLRAKWLAQVLWVRYWLFGVGGVVLFAALLGSVHPLGLAAAGLLLGAFVPFGVTAGLWLSVRCQSATRAVTLFVVLMIALFLAPLLLSTLTRSAFQLAGDPSAGLAAERLVDTFSVPYAVWEALFRWGDFLRPDEGFKQPMIVLTALVAAAGYALAAWGLWRDAVRVFEQEGK